VTMYPYQREDFYRFGFVGDEWLIEYSHQSAGVISIPAMIFSMVMSLELYLKAYYSKIGNPDYPATKFGHRTDILIKKLQNIDAKFPDTLKFNMALLNYPLCELDKESWKCEWYLNLPENERNELIKNYEFYLAMAYGMDLKYGISPSLQKHNGRIISSSWTRFSPKLSNIIIAIRNRISYPEKKEDDLLVHPGSIHPRLDNSSKAYLFKITEQTTYQE
jgi:hypothetical protein